MLLALLIVLGAASLATGVLLAQMVFVHAAFALSLAGLALVLARALRRRKRTVTPGRPAEDTDAAPAEETPDLVVVVAGRRRYHRADCAALDGTEGDELTPAEAVEEGFSPCTRCHPEPELVGQD
ncbi:hypothetical protein [Amycolatopsis methanolica]|uniref:Uncharacterized protein n=1 Tax=Amycolatopsis methanolica 239 TaxID=1068978 RepID=A0A076MW60_AMYME|nr:hypothetical protein [Amycolatopsis methanolica]AIJ23311.1 hypothetical protein AMETH_3219 [Amycolatopsis methanolica 239]